MRQPQFWWQEGLRLGMPVLILAGSVLGFLALGGPQKAATKREEGPGAPLVETVIVEPHSGSLDIEVEGVVVPYRSITVAAEVGGRIVSKSEQCEAGEFVERGTILLEIDPRNYQLEVERLESELRQAEATITESDVELENVRALQALALQELRLQENELKRLQQLPSKFASQTELDKANMAVIATRNSLQTLENQDRLIQARRPRLERARDHARTLLDKARLDLERTQVRAPSDGVVTAESVEEGGFVQPGAAICTFEDTSQAEIVCHLKPEEVYWLWKAAQSPSGEARPFGPYALPRTPITVIYRVAGQEFGWRGELARYDGLGMDERTRTIRCRAVVPRPEEVFPLEAGLPQVDGANVAVDSVANVGDPGDSSASHTVGRAGDNPVPGGGRPPAILPGMYVQVRIHLQTSDALLRIPERAVQPGGTVWKVAEDRLRIQPLEIVKAARGEVLVHRVPSLLEAGDRLVVSPLAGARDGMMVVPTGNP